MALVVHLQFENWLRCLCKIDKANGMQDEKTGYAFWHREEPSSILRRHAKRPDVPSYGIATDSIDWVFTKIDQALIGSYIETLLDASPENDTRLWDHQKRLNIREFQAVYTDKELATIGITDLDYPRIPRMVQSFSLEFWRGTAVLKFWRIWTEKMSEGAILADAVGLGKTIASRRESQH
ncbi:hypothetical protein AtubIFM54640_009028 [Aspergillus tubingensis]|nr:hypothetical protein AtubIFM54640_009028 [Aspergillus tubingensis]